MGQTAGRDGLCGVLTGEYDLITAIRFVSGSWQDAAILEYSASHCGRLVMAEVDLTQSAACPNCGVPLAEAFIRQLAAPQVDQVTRQLRTQIGEQAFSEARDSVAGELAALRARSPRRRAGH